MSSKQLQVDTQERKKTPFRSWLFSREDMRLKLQIVAAVILLVIAGWLTRQTFLTRWEQDQVYTQILIAAENEDYLSVIRGAEQFLSELPPDDQSERRRQVEDMYGEAIVHWLARQEDELSEQELDDITQTYTKLVKTSDEVEVTAQ